MTDKEKALRKKLRESNRSLDILIDEYTELEKCYTELLDEVKELRARLADSVSAGTDLAGVVVNLSKALARGA